MKYYFIINPNAGKTAPEIEDAIKGSYKDLDYTIYYTKEPKDATRYVNEICENNKDEELRFFACGGDGTICEVASGLVNHPNATLVPYPCGSGNDFVRYFDIDFKNIEQFKDWKGKPVDLIKIDGKYYSINVTNIGFDADVNAGVIELKKKMSAEKAYKKSLIRCLLKKFYSNYEITIDDKEVVKGDFILMSFANASYYGGGYKCAPLAQVNDGYIELCVVKKVSRLTFIRLVNTYKKGTFMAKKFFKKIFVYRRCKKAKIKASNPMSVCYDGEMISEKETTVEIVPNAINMVY